MAHTGCSCGVGLWNGHCPGGVNWDIFPKWQAEEALKDNPEYDIIEAGDYIDDRFNNGKYRDFWLCRRCRRIQIWDLGDKYVKYKKTPFDNSISVDEILKLEEWLAYSDWDKDNDFKLKDVLIKPFRPHRYFLSEDKQKIYVYNIYEDDIEFVYQEETREIGDNLFRNEHGIYGNRYEDHRFIGSYYIYDGKKVEFNPPNGYLSDAVYGAVVGDALGVPFEFLERGTFKCTGMTGGGSHNQLPGTWSDDSSMILATCKSIKDNNGKIVIDDIRHNFEEWLWRGKFTPSGVTFDVGNTTRQALINGKPEVHERSNGNGSLMRIVPLAFVDCTDDDVRAVSAITHGHEISMEACVIFINIFKECLKGRGFGKNKSLIEVVHDLKLSAPFDRLSRIDELPESEIRSSGYVVDTLEAALWCVLTSKGYEECLLKAVNLGDDTDTVACVAGALGSLQFSFDEFPDSWIDTIKNNDLIQKCLF